MFRAYAFMQLSEMSVRFTSEGFLDYAMADAALSEICRKDGFSGGGIEQKVPGIGWVVADDVETAVIGSRRNEE